MAVPETVAVDKSMTLGAAQSASISFHVNPDRQRVARVAADQLSCDFVLSLSLTHSFSFFLTIWVDENARALQVFLILHKVISVFWRTGRVQARQDRLGNPSCCSVGNKGKGLL